MNIKDAKQEIIHTIMAYTAKDRFGAYAIPQGRQRPLLLIGPPGIGKTAIMEQAAAECGVGFVSYTMTHHTRQSAIGLPFISHRQFDGHEYSITEYTMSEIIASVYRCIEENGKKEGLLFLDEINCVSETLAPVMLQFLQNKTFGNQHLPEGWILAAAGNPGEYNKSVREFDLATLDRLKYITVEADYDAWRPYALAAGIHGAILSYLDTHRDRFYVLQQTYTEKTFATARGWEDLSCILIQYESLKLPVTPELIGQYLRCEELAQDFSGYYRLYTARQESFPVIAMMEGEEKAAGLCRKLLDSPSFDEKLMLVHFCLSVLETRLQEYEAECSRLAAYKDALDRLLRFQKQTGSASLTEAMTPFLKNEENVLSIRREHSLSSEKEIRTMQAMLYELRELTYEYLTAHPVVSGFTENARSFLEQGSAKGARSFPEQSSTEDVRSFLEQGSAKGARSFPEQSSEEDARSFLEQSSAKGACSFPEQSSTEDARSFLEQAARKKEDALDTAAGQLLSMAEHCLRLFQEKDGPEFTILLSSLSENTLFTAFLRKHPCPLFEEQKKRLRFRSREELLKLELTEKETL